MKKALAGTALAALAAALAAMPAWGACQLNKLEIPVRIVNQRPIGTLNLNGTEMPVLIDSGAFYSMLTPSAAAQLNLKLKSLPDGMRIEGYTGAVEARLARVDRVIFQNTEISNVDFIVGGNELGSGIQGILGRNFLSMADTEYDLAHGVVRLMFPKGDCDKTNLAYWAGEAPVIEAPLTMGFRGNDTSIRVTARINELDVWAVLDTGAPRTSLKLRAARRAGVREADLVEVGRAGGVGAGLVRSWTSPIGSFKLGGEKIINNELRVDDVSAGDDDMLLGLDYFLSHRIYVSRLQLKLYATWNGGPVFARSTPGQYNSIYAARPTDVSPEDADALARRGEASAARGDLAQALVDLNRACELAPESAANRFSRARVHLAMRQLVKARRDLDEALRLQPSLHEALAIRASMRVAGGERGGALLDLFLLDTALPPSSHLREAMAELYAQLGQTREALQQWELWVPTHRADAHLAKVLNSRCRLRMRQYTELLLALKDCQEAVSRDRGEPSYQDTLGWTHLRLEDPRNAVAAFTAAIDRKSLPFALYGRALAHQRLSDNDNAERDLRTARRLRPGIDAEVRQAGLPVFAGEPRPAAPAPRSVQLGIEASLRQIAVPGLGDEAEPLKPSCQETAAPPTLLGPQSRVLRGPAQPPCQPAARKSGTPQPQGLDLPGR